MDHKVWMYLVYLVTSVGLTLWVATTLSRNGLVFLEDVCADSRLAKAVNHLLVMGFYLLNLGYVAVAMRSGARIPDAARALETLSYKIGFVLLVLGLLHVLNRRQLPSSALLVSERHQALLDTIDEVQDERPARGRDFGIAAALERLGISVARAWRDIIALVGFLGENLAKLLRLAGQPRRFRLTATVAHAEQVGLDAVPLVALLSFLVGAVVAFLGSTILRDFGAEIFVVELVNIAFLREFGVLLTAIVLAGRTASAFTAQIGAMKAREEIDALRALGLDVIDLLVLPRVIALLVMLPLLTFVAMMAGLAGGMTVGAYALDIPPQMYLARMHDTIAVRHLLVGISKAPLFALVIALIGCLEGLKVTGTAQSVGERTTSSVVQAISLVIVIDAFAAIWFMQMDW